MLSTCSEPLETFSPCMANCSSSIFDSGLSSNALAATTAATAEAAEPPSPLPSGMPLSMKASKPKPGFSASCMASNARPAVLLLRIARNFLHHAGGAGDHDARLVGALRP